MDSCREKEQWVAEARDLWEIRDDGQRHGSTFPSTFQFILELSPKDLLLSLPNPTRSYGSTITHRLSIASCRSPLSILMLVPF